MSNINQKKKCFPKKRVKNQGMWIHGINGSVIIDHSERETCNTGPGSLLLTLFDEAGRKEGTKCLPPVV